MNSNEIVYERKMTGSFMKLRCDEVKPLKDIVEKQYSGLSEDGEVLCE